MKTRKIIDLGTKIIYNLDDGVSANGWVRKNREKQRNIIYPHTTSALKICDRINTKMENGFIGSYLNTGNDIYHSVEGAVIYSTVGASGICNTIPITSQNFNDIIALFCARKTIKSNWIIYKDIYSKPNIKEFNMSKKQQDKLTPYQQWNNDAIIYSLFSGASQQSSLRQITYQNKVWDIKNEWFWMSNQEMKELAQKHNFDALYQDAISFPDERFVYLQLQQRKLSNDALEILEMAKYLVHLTFPKRQKAFEENLLPPQLIRMKNPTIKNHLNAWDAGWYQIKILLNEYFKEEHEIFKEKFKEFEKRMREGVYKFGFLKHKYTGEI